MLATSINLENVNVKRSKHKNVKSGLITLVTKIVLSIKTNNTPGIMDNNPSLSQYFGDTSVPPASQFFDEIGTSPSDMIQSVYLGNEIEGKIY